MGTKKNFIHHHFRLLLVFRGHFGCGVKFYACEKKFRYQVNEHFISNDNTH